MGEVPPHLLVDAFRRDWPREAELTELRLVNSALRDALDARQQHETRDDLPPHIREAMEEVGHTPEGSR